MSCIRIVDTSVLCNILRVPRRDQHSEAATKDFQQAIADGDLLLLPIPVIYETGNHIAQNGDGGMRRKVAAAFVDLVQKAFAGELPFVPTPMHQLEEMGDWLAEFPDRASEGVGLGDLAIRRVWDEQCRQHPSRRVKIWTYDEHLRGYDRLARL